MVVSHRILEGIHAEAEQPEKVWLVSRPPVGFHALCWGQDVAIGELLSEEFVLSFIGHGWQEIQYGFTDGVMFGVSGQTTISHTIICHLVLNLMKNLLLSCFPQIVACIHFHRP